MFWQRSQALEHLDCDGAAGRSRASSAPGVLSDEARNSGPPAAAGHAFGCGDSCRPRAHACMHAECMFYGQHRVTGPGVGLGRWVCVDSVCRGGSFRPPPALCVSLGKMRDARWSPSLWVSTGDRTDGDIRRRRRQSSRMGCSGQAETSDWPSA